MHEMYVYEVGKPYPGLQPWQPESARLTFYGGEGMLTIFLDAPTKKEIRSVTRGRADFALYAQRGQILLLFRFGSMGWSDAPFCYHLVPFERRMLPPAYVETGTGAALQVILVDARTVIVQGIRLIGLGHEFTLALYDAILKQASLPFNERLYDADLQRLMRNYQSWELAKWAKHTFSVKERSDGG